MALKQQTNKINPLGKLINDLYHNLPRAFYSSLAQSAGELWFKVLGKILAPKFFCGGLKGLTVPTKKSKFCFTNFF